MNTETNRHLLLSPPLAKVAAEPSLSGNIFNFLAKFRVLALGGQQNDKRGAFPHNRFHPDTALMAFHN